MQHDPALLFVEVDGHVIEPRVCEVGFAAPQRDQRTIGAVEPIMIALGDLAPIQFGALEGRRVLRVGNLVGVPAVLGELGFAPLGSGAGKVRLGV